MENEKEINAAAERIADIARKLFREESGPVADAAREIMGHAAAIARRTSGLAVRP
jgi:hypothetical protein